MTIEFINDQEFDIDTNNFVPVIKRLEEVVDCEDCVFNVVFVSDTYIRALNKSYRDKDEATDVLSFNYKIGDDNDDLAGEVYISVEMAEKQAKEHKHTLQDEFNKLLVHGLLHMHGYDHEEDEEYKKMSALEEKVLHF